MQDNAPEEQSPCCPELDQLTLLGPLSSPSADPKPGRPTGPRSPEGKAKSSLNRLTHGLRSAKAVLPSEDPAEYQATVQNWFKQYHPQHHDEITLVEETALAHWHFQRASKRLDDIEAHLPGNAWNWTDEHQKLFANFTRYKTTAERSLLRWYRELEAYQGRALQYEQACEALRVKTASVELDWLKHKEKSTPDTLKVRQLVQIERQGDRCVTSYYPSNEQILKELSTRPTLPVLVERSLEFLAGVPPEYNWAHPNLAQQNSYSFAVQRFFYSKWLQAIDREKALGHAGPMRLFADDPAPEEQLAN